MNKKDVKKFLNKFWFIQASLRESALKGGHSKFFKK